MRILICLFAWLIAFAGAVHAGTVSGRVLSQDGEPLAFANITIICQADSSLITGSISDENGAFNISLPEDRKRELHLRVTYVGYATYETPVDSIRETCDITMTPSSSELGEVTVTAPKPTTKLTGTGLLTNVANTELSSIGSAKDLLRFIPLLVNVGDSWTVLTKGTPVFYINGRKMRDKSELETLRSSDIVSVEVITNPGVQYSPGTTAVVKLKTRRPQGEGLSGMIDSNIGYSEKLLLIENANLNYRHGKFDVFVNGHYSKYPRRQTVNNVTELYTQPEVEFEQYAKTLTDNSNVTLRTGASYTINDKSSFGASYYCFVSPKSVTATSGWMDSAINGIDGDRTLTDNNRKNGHSPYHSVNAYYIGNIGKTSINFNADYFNNTDDYDSRITETPQQGNPTEILSKSHNSSDAVSAKLILSNMLWGGSLEYGVQYYHTSNRASYSEDGSVTTFFRSKLREQSIDPFIEYSRNFKFGYIIAGLRYEHLDRNYFENNVKKGSQSHGYDNLYPSLTWAKGFGNVQMQINYRSFSSHAPYTEYSDEIKYIDQYRRKSGNPNLKPARYQTVEVMGMWKFLMLTAWYNKARNQLASQSYINPDNPSVEIQTYVNLRDRCQDAGVSITAQPQFGWYQPRLSLSFNKPWYTIYQGGNRLSFNKPKFGIFLFNMVNLPKDWMIIVQFMYNNRCDNASSKMLRDSFDATGVVYKWFLNRKLKVSLIANDIFHTSKRGVIRYMGGSTTTSWTTSDSRSVWLGISYTFNATQSKYRGNSSINEEKKRLGSDK